MKELSQDLGWTNTKVPSLVFTINKEDNLGQVLFLSFLFLADKANNRNQATWPGVLFLTDMMLQSLTTNISQKTLMAVWGTLWTRKIPKDSNILIFSFAMSLTQ